MLKKIICIVIAAISLITVCFASDNLYSVEDFTIDNSIELPDFISTTVASLPETDSFLILKFTASQYIGNNNLSYTYYADTFFMMTSSSNVNWLSSTGVCSYELAYIVNHKGDVRGDASTTTDYTFDPSKAIIVNYRNFTVDGEEFTFHSGSGGDFGSDEEDKEYQSGVLGWFQRLFDKIADIPSAILNGLKDLFIPSDDYFETWFEKIKSNFNLLFDVVDIFDEIFDQIRIASDDPDMSAITVNFSSEDSIKYNYGNAQVALLDLSWYKRYKPYGDAVITCFVYLFFFFRFKAELPNILHGAGEIVRTEEFNHARIEKQNEINANRELWNKRSAEQFARREEYMKKREEYMASKKEYYDSKLKKGNK